MRHKAPSRVNAHVSDLPIARLDAQDLEQSLAIREYLEQNGVAVVVNRKPAIEETYHIICGDAVFVKETIASMTQRNVKPFVVLLSGSKGIFPESLHGIHEKIAVVTGTSISTRDVPQLFAYFITSDEGIFYLKNNVPPVMVLKPLELEKNDISPIMEESLMRDSDRISRVIGDMFGEKKKTMETRRYGQRDTIEGHREKEHRSRRNNAMKKRRGWNVLLLVIGIVIAPVTWYVVSFTMITAAQWYGMKAISQGDASRIATITRFTTYWVGQGRGALTLMALPTRVIGAGSMIRSQERALGIIGDIVTAERIAADLIDESKKIAPALLVAERSMLMDSESLLDSGSQHAILPVVMDRMRLKLDELGTALGLAGAQVRILTQDPRFPFSLGLVRKILVTGEDKIRRYAEDVAVMRNFLGLYRVAGGFDRKKTYLVILQNSMELRPTGGFIGSVAVITVEQGRIEQPVIQDVYALDGQLKGHVDPPLPIKELLQQEHWYLRDSNWDPDFRVSGEKAAWFYEKETGQSVDGVIAIATPILTDLLGVTGPLDLPDYNDRITRENFFGKSLFYTKANFFPGSTQKKDFLGSLMVALLSRLNSGRAGDAPALMRVLVGALDRGDFQFWFPAPAVQTVVEQAGWAGELVRPEPCEIASPPCVVERVALVESNMGVNKVNAFVRRSMKSRVEVSEDGRVDGTISVTYQNTSTDDYALSGGGTYLAYLRSYLPPDALVASVTIDGTEVSGKLVKVDDRVLPYRDPDETVAGSSIVGVAFTVPQGMERVVTMQYKRGIPLTFTDYEAVFVYSIRKQPGIMDTSLDVGVGYPTGWQVASSEGAVGLLATSREVRYNTTLDHTKTFTVRFKKK